MLQSVEVLAPAKLNLALDVTGRRADGYHTVDMLMQAVSLYEQVVIQRSQDYTLQIPGSEVPTGEHNTATKAAKAFFYETGLLAGCAITIYKRVPARAGMAGGSADAAAVLVGLNHLYGARLTTAELCAIGARIGADVPFAILGGTARVGGIGEILQPLPPFTGCFFTVAMPHGSGVSTPAAYAAYDRLQSPLHPNLLAMQEAIKANSPAAVAAAMGNSLQAASGNSTTEQLCALLRQKGALAAMMTGSGAAVYGLFTNEAAARHAKIALRRHAQQVFVVQPVNGGAQVVKSRR